MCMVHVYVHVRVSVYLCVCLSAWPQVQEFCIYARKAKPTAETPRIEECIQLFNGVTVWVVCSILREFTMVKRADIIEKFIDTVQVRDC